ncbi:MAG: phosphate/phosphite/phosphonate ABC transporter substrate-binding protein [Firmicutes bacterium]|nr:phosphate/phosphite/phosphonate ABC transporter substrate-binding protein [Bacillota bacterium]
MSFSKSKVVKLLVLTALVIALLGLFACSGNSPASSNENGLPATLYMAILIDDGNIEQEHAFEEFRIAMEKYIDIPVEMVTDLTHLVGIEAMRAGNLHLMWGSPFVYLLAQQTMDVERLVVTNSPNVINKTVFITGQDDIHSLDDLEGRTFGFVTPASASGFLYPMYYLINRYGLSRDEVLTPGMLFSEVIFSGSNNASIVGAAHGDFDGAAVGYIQFNRAIDSGAISAAAARILGYTPSIPFPGYIARTDLPEELRRQIQSFLVNWDNNEYSVARWNDADVRYAIPDPAEIEYLRSMVEILDIDLEEQG